VIRRTCLATLLVLAAGAGLALGLVGVPGVALGHTSDCHTTQTCPSDDGGYVWLDPAGKAWVCWARNPEDPAQAAATEIVHEGLVYACWDAVTTPTTTTEAATTATTETATTATATATETETEATETEPLPPEPKLPNVTYQRVAETPIGPAAVARAQAEIRARDAARRKRREQAGPPVRLPPGGIVPRLTENRYVFPVYGPAAFVDTFGAGRATTGWHHGEDIFAPLGAPVLAIADGTLFQVGWNDVGGNRLWLRDRFGNEFYYAHLSAFSPLAVEGRAVRAGEVVGFVGTTGDADGTPPHLHFEIHPVGLLSLGYDGVVAAYPYLIAWKRLTDLDFAAVGLPRIGWRSLAPESVAAPTPGALLLSSSDISTADDLDREAVDSVLAEQADALSGESPLESQPEAAATPAAGPPVPGLTRARAASAILAELRRQARAAAALSAPGDGIWDALSLCEAGGRWAYDGSSGFDGGLQFHPATWSAYRLPAYPQFAWQATRTQQIAVARRVLAEQGWEAWPVCSRRLGLRQ
jgi:murein DD-endopeptidase MepM/ murein hydrolase activator NlpD